MRWLLILLCSLPVSSWACTTDAIFSPYDDIEQSIYDTLWSSQTSIHASLFGISNERLADVLVEKAKVGVEVKVALDLKQSSLDSDLHRKLTRAGADVTIKPIGVLEHNKFVVVDGKTVVMGSWNWSGNAQRQDNSDVIFTNCREIAKKFEQAYERIEARDRHP